jgi:hypothetical protein
VTGRFLHRITSALLTVLAVCVCIRVADWLLAPLVPLFIVLCVLVAVFITATRWR